MAAKVNERTQARGKAWRAYIMAATQCDRAAFLRNLQKSGLLQPREFHKAIATLPTSDRGRVVARALVEAGVITRFQAELLLIGRTHGFFLGQYKILEQIGQGGMGRVYKAMHMTMRRIVALKVLTPQLVQTSKAMKMFRHEVRAAAQLHHPNIVTAFDANQIKNRHYLVMEYVAGPNLDQLVRQRGPLPAGLACELIRQTAVGLQYAHDMGLVHHDIKPANLLVQPIQNKEEEREKGRRGEGEKPDAPPLPFSPSPALPSSFRVKILDFGLARLSEPAAADDASAASDTGKPNTIIGTPDFLSPEQSRSLPGDTRSDIYSLGCTFYFLLTGRVPFPGGSRLEKLLHHGKDDPVTVELFRSDVPAEVLAALRKMLAKKPEERFQSQQEVVDALTPLARLAPTDLDLNAAAPVFAAPSLPSSADVQAGPRDAALEAPPTVHPDPMPTPLSDEPDEDDPVFAAQPVSPPPKPWPLWMLIGLGGILGALAVTAVLLWLR